MQTHFPQIHRMVSSPVKIFKTSDPYAPDGRYAYSRLALSLLIATIVGAGMWAIIVVLPRAQIEFGVSRAAASLPYTCMMFGLAFGTIVLGRLADRTGIVVPMVIAGIALDV
jgi:MFS family permease